MKASDLRIGNLVEWCGNAYPIHAINTNSFCIWDGSADIDNLHWEPVLKPIPLTEQELLKLGAKKESIDVFTVTSSDEHKTKLIIVYDHDLGMFKIAVQHFWFSLAFVHEWQNLYHALTGSELTTNNKK